MFSYFHVIMKHNPVGSIYLSYVHLDSMVTGLDCLHDAVDSATVILQSYIFRILLNLSYMYKHTSNMIVLRNKM
jgi:hypothetical protein